MHSITSESSQKKRREAEEESRPGALWQKGRLPVPAASEDTTVGQQRLTVGVYNFIIWCHQERGKLY